jgi:hypothetical protein
MNLCECEANSFTFHVFLEDIGTVSVLPQEECQPRNTVVPIPPDSNPAVFYWPTCVSVSRCGGCCLHSALACVPTARSNVTVQVNHGVQNSERSFYFSPIL